ncbi:hypothetical protein [Natronorubrum halophilum]|uniref:hypothetical protein n=1 Tax=Natronorubrum halophilum TaxID=1702106 RepID=UPI000EF69573|nr:hypothetical protein [Natronorubrum halophilum]
MSVTEKLKEATEIEPKRNAAESVVDMDGRGIMNEVQLIGGAMVTILIIALVLSEVYSAVDISEGPFSEIATDLETTGVAAISLLVVGLLVVAASAIMRYFGGGFGGGR